MDLPKTRLASAVGMNSRFATFASIQEMQVESAFYSRLLRHAEKEVTAPELVMHIMHAMEVRLAVGMPVALNKIVDAMVGDGNREVRDQANLVFENVARRMAAKQL
jgi:hypothetical protein